MTRVDAAAAVLSIHTASDVCEAAVGTPSGWVVESLPAAPGVEAILAPMVERLMRRASVTGPCLNRIVVVTGPGSFTGVRVGVAFARAFALALDCPLVGVTSLEAASRRDWGDEPCLVALPARRRPPDRSWWVQAVRDGLGLESPVELDEPQMLARVAETGRIAIGGEAPAAFAGSPSFLGSAAASAVRAAELGRMRPVPQLPVSPVYGRDPDARPQP